jgi:dTDP-4-amino-4,6-dideoxygalactose transaminase
VNETTVVATGINGKMSEFNAALGLVQLQHIGRAIERRGQIAERYRSALAGVPGVRLLDAPVGATRNHSYMPVLVGPEFPIARDALYQRLREHGVMARRYFYPLISDFPMYRGLASADPARLPVARRAAEQVLCLPIYPALADEDVDRIAELIRDCRATVVPTAATPAQVAPVPAAALPLAA